jgi:hypothetical protein
MADSCPMCIGACDCISPSEMDVPEVNAPRDGSPFEKIVLHIKYRGEERTFEIEEVSWRKFFRKYRKFRVKFGDMEWDIEYDRKNKVAGYDNYHPTKKMIILKNIHFPHPHSQYMIDFGWWLPRFEGGPKSKGRFAFFELYHDDEPLFTTQIGIYVEDDFSHLTPVWKQD